MSGRAGTPKQRGRWPGGCSRGLARRAAVSWSSRAQKAHSLQDAEELLARHEVDEDRIERTLREFDELLDTARLADWRRLRKETE